MGALVLRSQARSARKGTAAALAFVGVVVAYVAGLLIAASVNPGYGHQWYFLKGAVPFSVLAIVIACAAAWLLRFRLPVSIAAGVLVLCALTAIVFGVGYWRQPDRSADKARNLTYLNKVAPFPGAKLVKTNLVGIEPRTGDMFVEGRSFLSPPDGYTLEQEFTLPQGTRVSEALAHYTAALRRNRWNVDRESTCWNPYLPDAIIEHDCGSISANADDSSFTVSRNYVTVSIDIFRYRSQLRVLLG